MISVFQIDVAPGDEAAFDNIVATKLADAVNLQVNRVGVLKTVHVLKGDIQGQSNSYIVIVGIDGLGFSFNRAFKDVGFPASMKVTEPGRGPYHQFAKWPDKAPDIEP